jgi:hypothetical protein
VGTVSIPVLTIVVVPEDFVDRVLGQEAALMRRRLDEVLQVRR